MGPQDHWRAFLDGIDCTVCEDRVPADRIRLLARRDDLLFLQIACTGCGSTALGFIADRPGFAGSDRVVEGLPVTADANPITGDEVLDMHGFLDAWTGDLASLVGSGDGASGRADSEAAGPGAGRPRRTRGLRRAG